jgi:small GTP-binding protein
MASYKVDDIRNVALVGHGAAGKTSLADALLFKAKAVERRGSVDDGTSVADYDEEEKARRFSIDTALLNLVHQGKHVHVLDTPGYPDFVGAALNALSAVETALIVISAPNGIQVNTRRLFNEAGKRGLARMVIITSWTPKTSTSMTWWARFRRAWARAACCSMPRSAPGQPSAASSACSIRRTKRQRTARLI